MTTQLGGVIGGEWQPARGGGRNIGGTEGRVGKKLRGPPENAVAQGPPYG